MESKNFISNKTSLIINKNTKKKNSIQNVKKDSTKINENKTQHNLANFQNKVKGTSLVNQKIYKQNPSINNKHNDKNTKDLLTKSQLIRNFSYKNFGKNSNEKNPTKISINKKCKNSLFEYQTLKIIEDINKDLGNNNLHINNHNKNIISINDNKKNSNERNLSNENNNTDISLTNKNIKVNNKNYDVDSYSNRNNSNLNTNYKNTNSNSIISLLTSRNKIFKRNPIKNLKNIYNKNEFKSNYNTNNFAKNNCSSTVISNNQNLKFNNLKNKSKINNLNNLSISNINTITNLKPYNKSIINTKNTISNYSFRNNNLTKQNISSNYINYNKSNKFDTFKNCKKLKSKIIKDIENDNNNNSNSNFYINTSNSNNKKYIDKMKPSLKINEDYIVKNTILDNKVKYDFLNRHKTERGINEGVSSKDKKNKNLLTNNNTKKNNSIFSKKQLADYNINNKNIILDGINHINNNINKISLNYNLRNNKEGKSLKKNKKMLLLNNSGIFSPIIKLKGKGYHKHKGSIGTYSSKFKSININKNTKSFISINDNESNEKTIKSNNKLNINNSLPKKIGNKLNYLNINLNNLSNINSNTIYNNSNNLTTFPTHINTSSDNSFDIKKKIKNKFFKNQNTSHNKSLINTNNNNNIIILNNISMNNLNNVCFDYLSKLTKRNYQNSYKTIASIRRKINSYVSKEKTIIHNKKELERQREYYNNQKKLHQKKSNYKNNNRIKEQNLKGFNLKQINTILKKNKNNESTSLNKSNVNSSKNIKNKNYKTQRNYRHNNSISWNFNYNKKNISIEFKHKHNFSNNLNIETNKISNKKNNLMNNNFSNITYSNQKTINQIIKNLKEKMVKYPMEKKLNIKSEQISPNKIINNQLKPFSKEGKISNSKINNINGKKSIGHSIKVKKSQNNFDKKEKVISNDKKDKHKNIISEYKNNLKNMKKKINFNSINDANAISMEGIKKGKESKSKSKSKRKGKNKYKSHSIEKAKKNNFEIKIIKKKLIKSKNINTINSKSKEKEIEQDKKLIEPTEDIKDKDPQQMKEYITDIIESLLLEEDYYFNKKKYINPHYLENEKSELTPEMRTVAVDWLVLIHHKIFKFKENTLFLTIQIFDRYLSINDLNTEKTELLLLTSFMLASKHNEIDYVNMQETLQLSQNKFTKDQVLEMESDILSRLNFEILSPTMCEYFKLYASFLNLSEEKINHGFYVLNIVLVDFHMLEYPNFMLALAVVKLITKKFNKKLINLIKDILKENKIYKFLNIIDEDEYWEIFDLCSKIKLLYNTFLETKYKNIQDKFAEDKYNCVSTYTSI